ncbi:hypothetical protein [Rhodococcus sp. NPDC057529]|uniref:hypothetical protein n=1 Tax=Rhodococcus sp. NPDC057529 TaxID=3346158 RepID=UPI00366EA132
MPFSELFFDVVLAEDPGERCSTPGGSTRLAATTDPAVPDTVAAVKVHRGHAIIEQVHDDLKSYPPLRTTSCPRINQSRAAGFSDGHEAAHTGQTRGSQKADGAMAISDGIT